LVLALLSGELERDRDLCQALIGRTQAPIIAISPAVSESQLLAIFDTGVDDFIQRPVKTRELAARIRTILRRTQPGRLAPPEKPADPGAPPPARPAPPAGSSNRSKSIQALFSRFLASVAA
jgi:DNA-binding response OmpR family regulator